jgi:hypothetical protein
MSHAAQSRPVDSEETRARRAHSPEHAKFRSERSDNERSSRKALICHSSLRWNLRSLLIHRPGFNGTRTGVLPAGENQDVRL